jgi:hypothetical protein
MSLHKADPASDISAFEAEINRHVRELYSLTPNEIAVVDEGDHECAYSPACARSDVGTRRNRRRGCNRRNDR